MSNPEGFGFVVPHWGYWGWLMLMPPVLMLWSAYSERRTKSRSERGDEEEHDPLEVLADEDPTVHSEGNAFTRVIDWVSEHSGIFVAFWTINAVVAYFYEVVARYLFNAPTIFESAVRLCPLLHQGCLSTRGDHSDHLQVVAGVPGVADPRIGAVHPVAGIDPLAARCGVTLSGP
ncbi:hypothetical protein [Thiocapsa bogorovii]|uniref:hypothetical protein n=1 Tax=Thiocapsa bogorovii TaxID=521689 RepID=UPI001E3AFB07|nr:hypothetical protein [Thiocapsa bogorovii]UHD16311.1 hypothetical protein LT988_24215 [Thiocapsa bogorovii]